MGGRFYVMPFEVHDKLEETEYPQACRDIYEGILRNILISEDWETEGEWVAGKFRATKARIAKLSATSRGHFYRAWAALKAVCLIHENEDGSFSLPMYKKKSEAAIYARDIATMMKRIEELEEQNEEMLSMLKDMREKILMYEDPSGKLRIVEEERSSPMRQKCLMGETDLSHGRDSYPFKEEKEISLSGIVDLFYTGIGQKKISKEKRKRGNDVLNKLREDGFSLEDISFAVQWTIENAKEAPYDIKILQHTIGQAMAAKEKQTAREEKRAEEEREKAELLAEEQERKEIERYKESLSKEERAELRKQAEEELRASGEFQETFIGDFLIGLKENEILRKATDSETERVSGDDA